MDLSNMKAAEPDVGQVMNVTNPATEEEVEGMTLTLLGQESRVYKSLKRSKQNAMLTRMQKGRKAAAMDAEQLEADAIDELVKLCTGWAGVELNGERLDCTEENKRSVFGDFDWLKEQAQAFIADRSNFFR